MGGGGALSAQLRALHAVFANPQLRRLELSWMWTSVAVWGGLLAFAVYAYEEAGPAAVGLMALVRALPGAPAAPLLALIVDRTSRRRVMVASSLVRALIMLAVAGAVAADAPIGVVYLLAGVLAAAGPAFRPALLALTPRAARTPAELASASVAASLMSNAGFLLGTLAVGFLLEALSAAAVFALLGAAFAAAAVPLTFVERDATPDNGPQESPLAEAAAGWRAVRAESGLREPLVVVTVLYFVDGALDVLVVVAALGFLDVGEAGAGALNAVWAAGCVAGGAGVLVLLSRGHLTRGIVVGAAIVGAALAAVWAAGAFAVALLALAAFGVGYTLIDVAVATLLQRLAADHVLGRVGGITEAAMVAASALGALAAGLLAEGVGARASFVVFGALVPLVVLLRRRQVGRLEAGTPVPVREYRLLREHPIFAPLPVAEAERLVRALREESHDPGGRIITEGEAGDRFFLIADGEVDVVQGGAHRRVCTPGDGVGEIALLRDVPRTATVTARTAVRLFGLERDTFLEAIAGQAPASRAADRIVEERVSPTVPTSAA